MDILDKGRSKMASTIIGIQDMAKMNYVYGPELTKNMMNSCNSSIYLRVNSSDEAEYISLQIGSQEVERTSASDSVTDDKYTHSKSAQIVEKKLFLPSEILKWQDLEAVIKLVNIPYFLHITIIPRAYAKNSEGLIHSNRLNIPAIVEKQENENQQIISETKDKEETTATIADAKKEQVEKPAVVEREFKGM